MDEKIKEMLNLEISKIDVLVDKSSLFLTKCRSIEPDFFDLNAIGSILHSFYNGMENIFKLIHKAFDGKPFTNSMWHSELFFSMFRETETRKPVLPSELSTPLKDYLGFRHVFRHSYGYDLDWERLNPLFSNMKDTWKAARNCLVNFMSEK